MKSIKEICNSDKAVLVTGGSKGIGAAISKKLSANGWYVFVNYCSDDVAAHELVSDIEAAGGKVEAYKADIGDESEVKQMFAHIRKQGIPLHALVNNAGIDGGRHSVFGMKNNVLKDVMKVNYFGAVHCITEAVELMRNSDGAIVNLLSEVINTGGFRLSHYAASKSALQAYSTSNAKELAENGIRINCVSPGVIDTEMDKNRILTPEQLDSFPMKRKGSPKEVADAVAFLLSDDASYVAGTIVSVTGARSVG